MAQQNHLFMSDPDRFLLLLLLLGSCLERWHHHSRPLKTLLFLNQASQSWGCLKTWTSSTHQVRGVDDVRVPVAGHAVIRVNYGAGRVWNMPKIIGRNEFDQQDCQPWLFKCSCVKRFDTILTSNQQILGKYKVQLKIANGTVVSVALVLRAIKVYIELSQVSMMSSFPFSEALMCSSVGRRRDSCKMAAGLGLAG